MEKKNIEELDELIKEAMKSRAKDELRVLRLIKSRFMEVETAEADKKTGLRPTLDKTKELEGLVDERKKAIKKYKKGERQDLIDEMNLEIQILKQFLPDDVPEDQIADYTREVIAGLGKTPDMKDMGTILGKVKGKYPTAKGDVVAEILRELINKS